MPFAVDMFQRYTKHLEDVVQSIEFNIENYKKREVEMVRLANYKPEVYQKELDKIREKIKEADLKLSFIVPRIAKMAEQIEEMLKV